MAAALVLGALAGTAHAAAPPPGADCFTQVFEKRAPEGSWEVRECEHEDTSRYRIVFRGPQGQAAAKPIMRDTGGTVDVMYSLVSPTTLLIDAAAERGGRAYLVHPVTGSEALSVVGFRYMSDDEEGLEVRQDGGRIRARTRHGTHVFAIDARGVLRHVSYTAGDKGPRG